jgi:hypothetical protein
MRYRCVISFTLQKKKNSEHNSDLSGLRDGMDAGKELLVLLGIKPPSLGCVASNLVIIPNLSGSEHGKVPGSCKNFNEVPGFTKCWLSP